jgi:hypothetical protein
MPPLPSIASPALGHDDDVSDEQLSDQRLVMSHAAQIHNQTRKMATSNTAGPWSASGLDISEGATVGASTYCLANFPSLMRTAAP